MPGGQDGEKNMWNRLKVDKQAHQEQPRDIDITIPRSLSRDTGFRKVQSCVRTTKSLRNKKKGTELCENDNNFQKQDLYSKPSMPSRLTSLRYIE